MQQLDPRGYLGGDHALRQEDLLRRDECSEVSAGNHDSVGLGDDAVEVLEGRDSLDLGDDLDVGASHVREEVLHVQDVLPALHERGGDDVDAHVHCGLEVHAVLGGERGEVGGQAQDVAGLAALEDGVKHDLGLDLLSGHLQPWHMEPQLPVSARTKDK